MTKKRSSLSFPIWTPGKRGSFPCLLQDLDWPEKDYQDPMNIGFTDENTMAVVIRIKAGELFPASDAVIQTRGNLMSLLLCRREK